MWKGHRMEPNVASDGQVGVLLCKSHVHTEAPRCFADVWKKTGWGGCLTQFDNMRLHMCRVCDARLRCGDGAALQVSWIVLFGVCAPYKTGLQLQLPYSRPHMLLFHKATNKPSSNSAIEPRDPPSQPYTLNPEPQSLLNLQTRR